MLGEARLLFDWGNFNSNANSKFAFEPTSTFSAFGGLKLSLFLEGKDGIDGDDHVFSISGGYQNTGLSGYYKAEGDQLNIIKADKFSISRHSFTLGLEIERIVLEVYDQKKSDLLPVFRFLVGGYLFTSAGWGDLSFQNAQGSSNNSQFLVRVPTFQMSAGLSLGFNIPAISVPISILVGASYGYIGGDRGVVPKLALEDNHIFSINFGIRITTPATLFLNSIKAVSEQKVKEILREESKSTPTTKPTAN